MPVSTELSPELFGDAVMLLEFLHTFGPLFNIREVIRGDITFGESASLDPRPIFLEGEVYGLVYIDSVHALIYFPESESGESPFPNVCFYLCETT